ncbi:B- and T-lymphocyte attenuator-like [Cyprinodon tularosa]|uniref:B- and T-lymphocyte attenuator-like n=1 Tax=Cyprinodon tularosa TaxID=77115 RepID=UPI0018E1E2CC|nr:B- and T-lymphocyte attenuator-like [Cyprinodon tularosa]
MRTDQLWTALSLSIWAILFLTTKADNEDCIVLQVRRHTNHEVVSGQKFRIDCPVLFCNNPPPRVTWYKIEGDRDRLIINSSNRIRTGWEEIKPLEGVSFLIFQKIQKNDSGRYGCKTEGSVSHIINITVIDETEVTNKTNKAINNDTNEDPQTEPKDIFWMYVYSAAGIGAFVIIVIIISIICMQGCKRKSREEQKMENQYIEIPLAGQAVHDGVRYSPRGSPNLPPSRRASERKLPGQPAELTTSRENEPLPGPRMNERNRQRNVTQEQEPSSVVYAALNHGPTQREAPRPQMQIEETEYAAIRLP